EHGSRHAQKSSRQNAAEEINQPASRQSRRDGQRQAKCPAQSQAKPNRFEGLGEPVSEKLSHWLLQRAGCSQVTVDESAQVMNVESAQALVAGVRLPQRLNAFVVKPTVQFFLVDTKAGGQSDESGPEKTSEQQDDQNPGCVSNESIHPFS